MPGAVEGRAKLRRTVIPRRTVQPVEWSEPQHGHPVASAYVRTFWTAYLGPGAVADLLRLATAASRGRSLLRPIHLSRLGAAGLVRQLADRVEVRTEIPQLEPHQVRALAPRIRRMHEDYLDDRSG